MAATKRSSGRRKYGPKASQKVERAMRERNAGTLKSGRSGEKVTSRKQAIAIGLSEARKSGARVPKKSSSSRSHRSTKRSSSSSRKKSTARRASGNTRRRTSSRNR